MSLAPAINSMAAGLCVSPWIDAVQDKEGNWPLPEYGCEIQGLAQDDPKNKKWVPGEFEKGVDNVDTDPENNKVREWGGQRLWEGEIPPPDWDPKKYAENVQNLLQVPHLPGQPVKEMFARMKALDPRPFEDKYFGEIRRNLLESWPTMLRYSKHTESFGVHTEEEPAEWKGQEDELVPAVYPTPRPDTVTICVGVHGFDDTNEPPTMLLPGSEYDYLEFLYAKDQEDKVIQIMPFNNCGMNPALFCTYSFMPPKGTTSITPYACFKIRGAWKGTTIAWDAAAGSDDMQWYTDMSPEMKLAFTDRDKLQGKARAQVEAIQHAKGKKPQPVLWPENSWEGNAAKARMWDQLNQ